MDPDKINNRKPKAKNVKELQVYLGLINYYRRYTRDCKKICDPLLKSDVSFIFDQKCIDAFEKTKQLLTTFPILRHPDETRGFTMYCDASRFTIGAILGEYVIDYASRLLSETEMKYPISLKECAAIVFGFEKFEQYISDVPFTVVTYHKALQFF